MKHYEFFTGRIGKVDSEVRELGNGNCVANFSIAETPRIKKGDEWVDGVTVWTDVSVFGDEARNVVRSVKPGTEVMVAGTRTAREYTTKDTNEKRTVQAIVAEVVAVVLNKFTYIESLGSVNYKKGEVGTSAPAAKKAPASKPAPAKKVAPVVEEVDDFSIDTSEPDPFSDDEDPFGLD